MMKFNLTPDLIIYSFGLILFIAAFMWLLVCAWRQQPMWAISSFILAGLPLVYFAFRYWRKIRGALLLMVVGILFGFAAVMYSGDLIYDRHPDEIRPVSARLWGCSGVDLWKELSTSVPIPYEQLMSGSPVPTATTTELREIGRTAARSAALAYLPIDRIFQSGEKWGIPKQRIKTISVSNHNAVLLSNDAYVVLTFRGTDEQSDWYDNLKFMPSSKSEWSDGKGYVHLGFRQALDALWPQVEAAMMELRDQEQAVWITGHSLGGALAVLAAARFTKQGIPLEHVVTFGQPPVSYESFAEYFRQSVSVPVLRFINHVDAVVDVMSPITMAPLVHVGEELYIDTTGVIHEGGGDILRELRDVICADYATPAEYESAADFAAHYMRQYLVTLEFQPE